MLQLLLSTAFMRARRHPPVSDVVVREVAELAEAARSATEHARSALDAVPAATAEVMRRTPDDLGLLASLAAVAKSARKVVDAELAFGKARAALLKSGELERARRAALDFMTAAAAFHEVLFGHTEPDDHLTIEGRIGIERVMSPDPGDQLVGGRTLSTFEKAERMADKIAGRPVRDPRRGKADGYRHAQLGGTPTQKAVTAAAALWWPQYARVVGAFGAMG